MKQTSRTRKNPNGPRANGQVSKSPEPVSEKTGDASAAPIPSMCEPELDVIVTKWDAEKRQALGEKFARWGAQLCLSADMLKRFGHCLGEEPELVFPSNELEEVLRGKTRSQCLAEAAKFEDWCATIRRMLGVQSSTTSKTAGTLN